MISHGILLENPREEIIDGILYRMPPASAPCAAMRSKLSKIFYRDNDERFSRVAINFPITLDEFNEPIPDFCFLKADKQGLRGRHPKADEVSLILEIADETLDFERNVKTPLYASAEVPEVWLINPFQHEIERYSHGNGKMYNSVETFKRGEIINSIILPEIGFEVDEIMF